jgi:predicted DNA-binding helix-hairpin-helix protein
MNLLSVRGRLVAACAIVVVSVPLVCAAAVAADRQSGEDQVLRWLLAIKIAQGRDRQRLDINAATVDELRAVPGIERDQALRIIARRPYTTLQDLSRADFSPVTIERLSKFLVVDSDWPSALPGAARAPRSR